MRREDPIRFYFWPVVGRFYRESTELCLSKCRGGERVLEVGFGSGVSFINLSEKYKEIYGIDTTARIEEVRAAFANMGIQPFLQRGNVLNMPYPDEFFDTVLLVSILEHLKPSEQARPSVKSSGPSRQADRWYMEYP